MRNLIAVPLLMVGLTLSAVAFAQALVGQPAPKFNANDFAGKPISLDAFKGKYVIMEWFNPNCPFVKKHYNSGNMQMTQKYAADKGVVWVSVNTGSHADDALQLSAWLKSNKAMQGATLLDSTGEVGKAYGARTTPHMYLIDPAGTLVYAGAIDSKPTANMDDIKSAENYVVQAIDESIAGKPLSKPVTKAYGCSVKYSL